MVSVVWLGIFVAGGWGRLGRSKTHIRMPVELTKRTRLKRNNGSSNSSRDRKVPRINNRDVPATTWDRNASHSRRVVEDVRAGAGEPAVWSAVGSGGRGGVEDVWVLLGDVVEDGDVDAEVPGEDVARGVRDPVVDHEGRSGGVEVAWVCQFEISFVEGGGGRLGGDLPLSKATRASFSSSRPWMVCADPLGKYQISPSLSVSTV